MALRSVVDRTLILAMELESFMIWQLSGRTSVKFTYRTTGTIEVPPGEAFDNLPNTSVSRRSGKILSTFLQEMNNREPPRAIRRDRYFNLSSLTDGGLKSSEKTIFTVLFRSLSSVRDAGT